MNIEVIDKLYKYYQKPHSLDMLQYILTKSEKNGNKEELLNTFKEYLKENVSKITTYCISQERGLEEKAKIKNLVKIFEKITYTVNLYLDDLREIDRKWDNDKDMNRFDIELTATNLFSIDPELISKSYERYASKIENVTPEIFTSTQNLINRVRSDNALRRLFKDNDWKQYDIQEILLMLYDFYGKNCRLFNIGEVDYIYQEEVEKDCLPYFFTKIKDNCEKIDSIDFKSYRPTMFIRNGIDADIDKLVFCRNFLEFARTGIIPTNYGGFIEFEIDEYETLNIVDKFSKLYSKGFDNKKFIESQCNFIFNVDASVFNPEKILKIKKVQDGKSLAIGSLLCSNSSIFGDHNSHVHLLHIYINDITDNKSNYEIQLSALPEGDISHRIQLIRLDNWKELQPHKNIGNKLQTTTHIHLYNHLDLLRGNKNVAYDIAFNFSEHSTEFDDALKTFVSLIFSKDKELGSNLINRILKMKGETVNKYENEDETEII